MVRQPNAWKQVKNHNLQNLLLTSLTPPVYLSLKLAIPQMAQGKYLYPKAKESQGKKRKKENLLNYMDNFINKCLIYPLHLDMVNSGE